MPIGEKLNEAYTWQAVYETIPLNLDNLQPLYPKMSCCFDESFPKVPVETTKRMIYAGDLTGEIVSDLWEIDANGIQINAYNNIDRAKLSCFNVYKTVEAIPYLRDYCTGSSPSQPLLAKPFITVEIRPGYRLIWRRRRRQRAFGGTEGTVFLTLYMAGWQESYDIPLIRGEGGFVNSEPKFQAINYIYHHTNHGFDTTKDVIVMSRGAKNEVELFDFEIPLSKGEICQNMSISHCN